MAFDNSNLIDVNSVQGPEPTPVQVDTQDNSKVPLPNDVAESKAKKYAFAFPQSQQTYKDYLTALQSGNEQNLREGLSSQINLESSIKRSSAITDAINRKGGPLSDNELLNVIKGVSRQSDPRSVMEDNYAKQYVDQLDPNSPRWNFNGDFNLGDTFWSDALNELPHVVALDTKAVTEVIAKREYAITKYQEIEAGIQKEPWLTGDFGTLAGALNPNPVMSLYNIAKGMFTGDISGKAVDMFKGFIPFYQQYKEAGQVPEAGFNVLAGSNLENQTRALLRNPYDEYKDKLDEVVDRLAKDNPQVALHFLSSVIGRSTDDKNLDNMGTLADVALAVPGKTVANIGKALVLRKQVKNLVKDIVKSTAAPEVTPASRAEALGDIGESAVQKASDEVLKDITGVNNTTKAAVGDLTTNFRLDLERLEDNPTRFGNAGANILREDYTAAQHNLFDIILNTSRALRVPLDQATPDVVRAFKDEVKKLYPGKYVLDVHGPYLDESNLTKTWYWSVDIGKPGRELFLSPNVAKQYATANGFKDFKVRQKGLGYYIELTQPHDETSVITRDFIATNPSTQSNVGGLKSALGLDFIRSSEDVLPRHQSENRAVATYAKSRLQEVYDNARQIIADLKRGRVKVDPETGEKLPWWVTKARQISGTLTLKNRQKWKQFERALEASQEMRSPSTGKLGYMFQTPQEMEEFYLKNFQRRPDFDEVRAYEANRRLFRTEQVLHELTDYMFRHRVGSKQVRVWSAVKQFKKSFSDFFDAIPRQELPTGSDLVVFIGDKLGEDKVYRANRLPHNLGTRRTRSLKSSEDEGLPEYTPPSISDRIKSGELKVYEIYDPESRPLKNFGGSYGNNMGNHRIRYVITKNAETKPLEMNHIPFDEGRMIHYEYPYAIKQARVYKEEVSNIVRHVYEDDSVIMAIDNHAMGKDVAKHLDNIRLLLKNNPMNESAAKEYARINNLMMDWKDIRKWFRSSKDKDGKTVPPLLNKNEPIQVVPMNSKTADVDKELARRYPDTFFDGTKSGSQARRYQLEYNSVDRYDLLHPLNVGTKRNPIYKFEPAKPVDPITTLNRSLDRMSNSFFMEDYKLGAVENWLQQASKYLKTDDSDLRNAPMYHFSTVNLASFKSGVPNDIKFSLLANKQKIQQFIGQPSKTQSFVDYVKSKLSDWTYETLGPSAGPKAALVPNWLIQHATDIPSALRSMVFHEKLGLFALPQIVLQQMTYLTMFAINPKAAAKATAATLFHQWSRLNPRLIDTLDEYATKLGYKPGEWKEAAELLKKTGFANIGGEYINADEFKTTLVKSAGRTFLDWGTMPFKGAERNVRFGAWFTAMKEFRDAHPYGKISDKDLNGILKRADDLSGNMSRASASILNKGVMANLTQFLNYQIRLTELFYSKRLVGPDKSATMARARLFLTYAAMFGVPSVTGIATVFPMYDYLRQKAIDAGYNPGENTLLDLVMNGIPATLGALIKGDVHNPDNFYNVANRYGSPGLTPLRDLLNSDKAWWQIFAGASTNSAINTLVAGDGFKQAMLSLINGSGYHFTPEDAVEPLKEIQTFNAAWKLRAALNTGKLISKSGIPLMDTSPANAIFMSITGLQPQSVDDFFSKSQITKEDKGFTQYVMKKVAENLRRSFQAQANKDSEQALKYRQNAYTWGHAIGDLTPEQFGHAISMAADGNEDLIAKGDYGFAFGRDVPESKRLPRMQNLQKTLKLKQGIE